MSARDPHRTAAAAKVCWVDWASFDPTAIAAVARSAARSIVDVPLPGGAP